VTRVAAVADIHFATDSRGRLRPHLEGIAERADVLLIAGDLTTYGHPDEAATLADELRGVDVPVFAVLGNHDYHFGREDEVRGAVERAGVRVLEGDAAVIQVNGVRVGVAGVKGFGGGFAGACGTEFGEPEMKAFIAHTRSVAERLEGVVADLDADVRIVLLHYAPVKGTLLGERLEIYPFLGSYLLAEAVDRAGADLVFHGHAHRGTEKGVTPGGIHVRNVALPVIRRAYNVYSLDAGAAAAAVA
jgi:Icc-related predicted phosphoesterase